MTPEDILAAGDVLDDVMEASDSMDVETAVAYREAVNKLWTKVRDTVALLDAQLVTVLESPRVINGFLYEVRPSDGKWRPDHSKVNAKVKESALVDVETGEMFEPADAVERAIKIMSGLYVAASTMPKVGALGDLGLKKWDVAEQEPGTKVLKVTPTAEGEQ